jgi:hypothetical protein
MSVCGDRDRRDGWDRWGLAGFPRHRHRHGGRTKGTQGTKGGRCQEHHCDHALAQIHVFPVEAALVPTRWRAVIVTC